MEKLIKRYASQYFNSWWLPSLIYLIFLTLYAFTSIMQWQPLTVLLTMIDVFLHLAIVGILASSIWNFIKKKYWIGSVHLFLAIACIAITLQFLLFRAMFGSSEDGFADQLTIPKNIEIAEPDEDSTLPWNLDPAKGSDAFQKAIRNALSLPGNNKKEFTPSMPSLRKASTTYAAMFHDYLEASTDWKVFIHRGNRFALRRWSYEGEPKDTLNGYISEFNHSPPFQMRCLLCLDLKKWSWHSVQRFQEGSQLVYPSITRRNNMKESTVMIECGGVWIELFEQSTNLERRITKASITFLENEFSAFVKNPKAAITAARARSRSLASRLVDSSNHAFKLINGIQPGIYVVAYALNPGESGSVYLKAFEITKETPLSKKRLKTKSRTRMTWSSNPEEKFGGKAGFTIYEGDWGKPYAARFEVWFTPDSGKADRKLAERVFKIEGWQR